MPELPEVETIRQALADKVQGAKIIKTKVFCRKLRQGYTLPCDFEEEVNNQTVLSVVRRGKYILLNLSANKTILIHLGMTGKLLLKSDTESIQKHDHIIFYLDSENKKESKNKMIVFNDVRRFGLVLLFPSDRQDEVQSLQSLGQEPLADDFTGESLYEKLKDKTSPIKTSLLNQNVVAGLGNIYVCEVLFRTGISPFRQSKDISLAESKALCQSIKQILRDSLSVGGTTFRDYRHFDGTKGEFVKQLSVYGRQGKTCPNCDLSTVCQGVVKQNIAGRSTFYCPLKQK